ncbi:hypothetical protein JD969_20865 [Planctomycetota bacterium]|nr:hypothetical protein JD969_20865 [Planctomycetota bacterium]
MHNSRSTSFTNPKPRITAGMLAIHRRPGETQGSLVQIRNFVPLQDCGLRLATTEPQTQQDDILEYELAGLNSSEPFAIAVRFVEELATDPHIANHPQLLEQQGAALETMGVTEGDTGGDGGEKAWGEKVSIDIRIIDSIGWEKTWGLSINGKLIAIATGFCHVTVFQKIVQILHNRMTR